MTNKFGIRSAGVAVLLGALGASGVAFAQTTEVEPNNPIGSAQPLVVDSTGTVTVTGNIDPCAVAGCSINDVDFYTFQAKAGDVVTIDIDGTTSLDSLLTLFGPGPNFDVLTNGLPDVGNPPDPGSETNPYDPLIPSYPLLADGTYTVAVSAWQVQFIPGGTAVNTFGLPADNTSSGSYTLIISGVTPPAPPVQQPPAPPVQQPPAPQPVQQINIEIKPGIRAFSLANPKAKGAIPVALLSSKDFNAPDVVDRTSLTFGETGDEKSLLRCHEDSRDVNHDGRPDLVCLFDWKAAGFQPSDVTGIVKGKTTAGDAFEGQGTLKVLAIHKRRFEHGEHRGEHEAESHERR